LNLSIFETYKNGEVYTYMYVNMCILYMHMW